jgi:hypothetical protein
MPVFDERTDLIIVDRSNIGSFPLGEINVVAARDCPVRARYHGRGAQRHGKQG